MSDPPLTSAEKLFQAFSQWCAFARRASRDDSDGYLVTEVPTPVGADVELGLLIDTTDRQGTGSG